MKKSKRKVQKLENENKKLTEEATRTQKDLIKLQKELQKYEIRRDLQEREWPTEIATQISKVVAK